MKNDVKTQGSGREEAEERKELQRRELHQLDQLTQAAFIPGRKHPSKR